MNDQEIKMVSPASNSRDNDESLPAPPPQSSALAGILKQTSAYDPSSPAGPQFFPSEPLPDSSSTPLNSNSNSEQEDPSNSSANNADPTEDDYDDPDGALWSGPAAMSVPTSISGFRMRARSRGEIDRGSREFVRNEAEQSERDEENEDDTDGRSLVSRRSRKSSSSRRSRRKKSKGKKSRRNSEAETTEAETDDGESVRSGRSRASSTARSTIGRRSSLRRKKKKAVSEDEDDNEASAASSEEDEPVGFFEGLSNALRGRRPSMSRLDSNTSVVSNSNQSLRSRRSRSRVERRSADFYESDAVSLRSESEVDPEEDPYGPYGSDDTASTSTSTTQTSDSQEDGPRRRRGGGGGGGGASFLPGGGAGDFFGESRIDFDEYSGDDDEMSSLDSVDEDKKGGPPTHQLVYIPDEDLPLRFVGLHVSKLKTIGWWIGCVLTGGILWLLGRWLPNLWRNTTGKPGEFEKSSYVVVETYHHASQFLPLQTLKLPVPVPLSTIFPPSVMLPPAHRDDVTPAAPEEGEAPTSTTELSAGDDASITNASANGNDLSITSPLQRSSGHSTPVGNGFNPSAFRRKSKGPMIDEIKFIDYRYYRFMLHPDGQFRMVRDWKDIIWRTIPSLRRGLPTTDHVFRTSLFGSNAIEIEAKSVGQLLMDEVLHPFYIFQIFSIILWSIDDYYYYAFAIAIISVVSIISTLIETRANVERMREMSRFSCNVKVFREGEWITDDSTTLVPGDVIDLSEASLTTFPADLVLLSGDAIVNESMLTGESVPVSKVPVEVDVIEAISIPGGDIASELARHVVFNGTKIIRVRQTTPSAATAGPGLHEAEALGMVLRTGFNTTKGALVRSMLFPKPFGFAFYRDSFRFIGVLGMVAVCGFMASSVNFVKLGISWSVIVIRALDLVTIVVPPALPATMAIGTSFAIARLRKMEIFCISPTRVNIGGKVNIVCFDKTGTLTEEGLDVLGVHSVVRSANKFTELHRDPDDVPIFGAADAKTPLLHALATCHALKVVNGEVIGDPLDLRMFDFTGWTLEEGKEGIGRPSAGADKKKKVVGTASTSSKVPERAATLVQTVVRPPGGESFKLEDALKAGTKHAHFLELGVLRSFDFVSSLRRMSVLVKKLKSNSVEAYVKGAPEVMVDICDKSTLPGDYEEILAEYTKNGFRVIALAGKSMPNLTWIKAQRLKRDAVESDLRFLGLVVFENKLKPGTTPAIATFRAAHIPTRMVTGDNVRTAISVGRECGMILPTSRIYLPSFLKGNSSTPRSQLEWTDVDDETRKLDSYSLKEILPDQASVYSGYEDSSRDYHLAVTGDVFRWMMDFGALETLQRLLVKGVIFARMSPDEKHELVERLQSLGYTVGFCGDGANDCGALKAADVGLSLSEAEASVAAPFTSRQPDIRCFLEVIKEGRASLVTSFSCFKFMALYSLIQFTTVSLLYAIASTLGDFQFLYIDLALILPIAVTMGRTEPFPRIHPKRPTANLISKKVLTSLIGQIVLTSGFQIFTFFFIRTRDWYDPPTIDPDHLDIVSAENTSLFLISSFQYILVAAVFCVGPPYRKPLYTNRWLVFVLVLLSSFSLYTLFTPSSSYIFSLLEFVTLPHDFHLELLLLIIGNVAASWAFEEFGAEKVAKWIGEMQRKWRRMRGKRKEGGKAYKAIQRSMED
ncbi:putative acid anhydride hydrolase [Sporobolomyces salmoneus]|uniref:putative acid anhydride hydrolase n=1 Tax=Sporobolomyces salmoneus TaxID=183962 RepID=UPI00316BC54C